MKINYILLIHKSPEQVYRLVSALSGVNTTFYLHVDKKVSIVPYQEALKDINNLVFMSDDDRFNGQWGGIELIYATLGMLRMVQAKGQHNGYTILLSGQDYPIRSTTYINSFLEDNNGKEFIDIFPMPKKSWWPLPDGMHRLNRYLFRKSSGRYDFVLFPSLSEKEFYTSFFLKELGKLLIRGNFMFLRKILKPRVFPNYLKPYGGHQWFAFTGKTVDAILNFLGKHPDYLTYHQDSLVPDEVFFQPIIKHLFTDNSVTSSCLNYANWTREIAVLPVTFDSSDIKEIVSLPDHVLYARKFDIEYDAEVLDLIDKFRE
jgi:hypothetical protein